VAVEGAAQVGLEGEALEDGLVHASFVDLEAALAPALGRVHGEVGVADEFGGAVAAGAQHDAEAGVERDQVAVDAHRVAEDLEHPGAGVVGQVWFDEVLEQDGELVAPEPGAGVALTDDALEAASHRLEDGIAGGVAEAVVDGLEVVEVEEED